MDENKVKLRQLGVDEVIEILGKLEKAFNDAVDWHIVFFQEQDAKKRELYYTISESKRVAYEELKKKVWEQYE
ncbi:MAG TPA: hypothetical protein VMR41_05205 [Patescibacteria group bacterium]|nr:hypothetical protein [Patescibacteria group bacterium]